MSARCNHRQGDDLRRFLDDEEGAPCSFGIIASRRRCAEEQRFTDRTVANPLDCLLAQWYNSMCSGADKLIGANLSAYGVEGDHGDEKLGNNGTYARRPVFDTRPVGPATRGWRISLPVVEPQLPASLARICPQEFRRSFRQRFAASPSVSGWQ